MQWFTEVLVRCDNESSILALKESTATTLKLAGVTIKAEESALYDSQKQRAGRERCEGCERCRENELGLLGQTLRTRIHSEHPVLSWLVKYSVAMVNRYRRGPDGKTAYELRKERRFARAPPYFCGEKSHHDSWGHEGCYEN